MDIEVIKTDPRALLPKYGTIGAAAFDLFAMLDGDETLVLKPGDQALVRTGLKIWIKNPAYCVLVIPRSGLGSRGLVMAHGTGLIDSDYQGELFVPLLNRKPKDEMWINPMDRIAQALIVPVMQARFVEVAQFSDSSVRGEGGFGSTGT